MKIVNATLTPDDDLDDFLGGIAPMSVFEQQEMLLQYFTAILDGLSVGDIEALREHFRRRFPPGPEQDAIFEVMDGHIALRKLRE